MHALGFYHEHQRPDRDDYINVDKNEMSPKCVGAVFEKFNLASKIQSDGKWFCHKFKFTTLNVLKNMTTNR